MTNHDAPRRARENPEPIRPIVGRVVAAIREQYPTFLEDPVVASLYGFPVEPSSTVSTF